MLTKEQRDEIRARSKAAGSDFGSNNDEAFTAASASAGDVPTILDALDEMERERDRAAGTRDALANECNRVASALGIRDDDSSVLAIGALTEERDELADVLRSLGIRHRNEDGSKRTADEMWAELKARAIDQEHEVRDGWDD